MTKTTGDTAKTKIAVATKTICASARKKTGETNSARTMSGGASTNAMKKCAENAAKSPRIAAHNAPPPELTRPAVAEPAVHGNPRPNRLPSAHFLAILRP